LETASVAEDLLYDPTMIL